MIDWFAVGNRREGESCLCESVGKENPFCASRIDDCIKQRVIPVSNVIEHTVIPARNAIEKTAIRARSAIEKTVILVGSTISTILFAAQPNCRSGNGPNWGRIGALVNDAIKKTVNG